MKERISANSHLFALLLAAFLLLVDFVTKLAVHHYLPLMHGSFPYGGIAVFPYFLGIEFSISHATNEGAAWGLFAHYQFLLLLVRIALTVALFAYFWTASTKKIPLALILAGATGNILDYFLYGHVVDMLHFVFWGYDYPVFNVADSAIFIGILSLFLIPQKNWGKVCQ